jgi:ABC-type transport system involved in cytochrome bd biosynthesis fused ATPase/permease subunit
VDAETDELMQRIIREEFETQTLIVVAHRLNTILDFDRIAVFDEGVLIECDTPAALLSRASAFRDLYDVFSRGEGNTSEQIQKAIPKLSLSNRIALHGRSREISGVYY